MTRRPHDPARGLRGDELAPPTDESFGPECSVCRRPLAFERETCDRCAPAPPTWWTTLTPTQQNYHREHLRRLVDRMKEDAR